MVSFIKSCLLTGAAFFSFTVIRAQVQFSTAGSLLKGTGYYDNHSYLLGGGASMKYVYKDRYLLGITGRTYQANTTAYEHFNASTKAQNISGTFEVIFNRKKKVKPYFGLDAGRSSVSHMVNYIRINDKFFVASLKSGFYYFIGQSTGFFIQLQYNYVHDSGKYSEVGGVNNPVILEPIQKYWAMDGGFFIRLYTK